MASYCCFRRQRKTIRFPREIPWPWGQGQVSKQLISFQDMLGLLVRPDVGVIVIQGIGGSGKTWAANAAYRAARTSNLFQEYVWVPLSMNCTMGQCINKIATSLSCNQGDFRQECNKGDNFSIERAKAMIKEYLTKRKFLLVLDNVYFTEESILECLGVPRPKQQSLGSKIFVTTRTVRGKSIMEPDIVLTPLPLTYEDSHDLLREKIGKDTSFEHDLISYFFGMPLTVVLLAGVLCDAPTQEAFSELVTKAYDARGAYRSEFDTLERMVKFAYHQLPSNNVRHCLLYCLLFPEHQGISVKELIWYWIMDGLFQKNIGFDEANHIGKEILDVLIKRGMVYLDDNGHVRMHDVVRETVSRYGKGNGYKEQHEWHVSNPIIRLEHLAKYSRRVLLMDTEMECLYGSPRCSFISSLHLRGNYLLKAISEEFFRHMGQLEILDLSFTLIQVLPRSISFLTRLRMLLLIGCDYLKEIQHITPLVQLEILDASGCGSLKSVGSGSFDHMALLKLLDLSATSITFLTSIPVSMELRHLNLQGCPFLRSELPYGVSKSGAVRNMQLGNVEDLADWMDMLWLPSGLTFNLSDKHGLEVSLDANMGVNTYVYASDAYFFNCLKKDSPLWLNCFRKFQIVISCSTGNQTMDTDVQAMKTDSIFQNSYFRTKRFSHFIEPNRYLEINGTVGVPYDLDGILGHAELISLKRLAVTTQLSDLNISRMEAARELWVENCDHLESFLTADVIQALSAMGNLHNLWISNMESLSYFCKGVEDVTSFSCLKHLLFDCCPNIICLFPSVLHFQNLETLNIKFCDILERVFGSSALGEDTLPRLQSLQLWELPELTSVCTGVLPSLKNLKVRGCAKLRKIPVGVNENSPFVTTIGEELWWDSLIWDDETIKRWLLFRNWRPLLPHIAIEG